MQIGYINIAKRKKAVLLDPEKFLTAAEYAVAKEKLAIVNTFVDYIALVVWIGVGISFLQQQILLQDEALQTIAIVMGFLLIGSVISLPFSYYEKFVIDKEFGFNKSTLALWIKILL
jgi:STE24 endopeptidase